MWKQTISFRILLSAKELHRKIVFIFKSIAFWVEQKESNQNTFSTTSELKYLLKKMTENNIGLTIGRNYRKSNISTFKPRKLGGILRKE